PGLVLRGVAAVGLHLIAGDESGRGPALAECEDVLGGGDLEPEMRERAGIAQGGNFVQREIQRRLLNVEFRVAGADLRRLDGQHAAVEGEARLEVADVDRDVRFQNSHIRSDAYI